MKPENIINTSLSQPQQQNSNRPPNIYAQQQITTIQQPMLPVVPPQPRIDLINWRWVTIDPLLLKDVSIPCIIRPNDNIKEYISVRIIEASILLHFENILSDEAKNFGVLETFHCTPEELFLLNDINQNHVDKLYGEELFTVDNNTLVGLDQFLKFYEIVRRTGRIKPHSKYYPIFMQNLHRQQNYRSIYSANQQTQISQSQLVQPHLQQLRCIQGVQPQIVQPRIQYAVQHNFQIQNMHQNVYSQPQITNQNFNEQRVMMRIPNMASSQYSHQYINYPINNQNNNNNINIVNSLNRPVPQHQIIQLIPVTNFSTTPQVNPQIIQVNSNYSTNQITNNFQTLQIQQPINGINVNMSSATTRNLTPPLTPLENLTNIVHQITENNNGANQRVENDTRLEEIPDHEIICLDNDDQITVEINNLVLNDKKYNFVQINDKIMFTVDLENSYYKFENHLSKCHKYVPVKHLINFNFVSKDDYKSLSVQYYKNSDEIKTILKWFNRKNPKYQLEIIEDDQIELVNIIQFQYVYANRAIFFKHLYNLSKPAIKYVENFSVLLEMTGGLVYTTNTDQYTIRPFVNYKNKMLITDCDSLILKSKYSKRINFNEEKILFAPDSECEMLNEFLKLQIFYSLVKVNEDVHSKVETVFYNLEKWIKYFPDDFRVICFFDKDFPGKWQRDFNRIIGQIKRQEVTDEPNNVNETEPTTSQESDSVYMSPQSVADVQTISLNILNEIEEISFTKEELAFRPNRVRSYSTASVSRKRLNKNIMFLKYAKLFCGRNSCTALNFIQDQSISKSNLLEDRTILERMINIDDLIEKKKLEEKIIPSLKSNKKIKPIVTVKTEIIETESENSVKASVSKPVIEKSNDSVEPKLPKLIIKTTKEKKIVCEFLADFNKPSSSSCKTSCSLKRKKSKILDPVIKKRNCIEREKEQEELRKDLNFVVPDDQISVLKENEKFNFTAKQTNPKNLQVLYQSNDLYSTESFDRDFYLKKFKIKSVQVKVNTINIDKYMRKLKENESKRKSKHKSKSKLSSNKRDGHSSISNKQETFLNSRKKFDDTVEIDKIKKSKTKKILRIESDDEDELPRLDFE